MGKIIVIEGMDGAGKASQSKALRASLENDAAKVIMLSFPVYSISSGKMITEYLTSGLYPDRTDYLDMIGASNLYAANRHQIFYGRNVTELATEKYPRIIDYYNDGYTIICDRYTSSNLLFMAANLYYESNHKEIATNIMDTIIASIQLLEYGILQIPKPDITILLKVDPDSCYRNLLNRYNGDLSKLDKNEKLDFITAVHMAIHDYEKLTQERTLTIDCMDDHKLLSIPEVQDKLYSELLRSGVL